MYRNVVNLDRREEGVDALRLPDETVDDPSAVVSTDVEVSVVRHPPAAIGHPDPADVAPRLDDPDPARGDYEMINRAAGPRDPAIVEDDDSIGEFVVQATGQATSALVAARPWGR
jgi:hypothetical protein